jgi:AbrB family looped-hinge helix DNA binding protein
MAHGILHAMKVTLVPIDKAGRVVLPKWVREGANLAAGDELKVSLEGQRIQLEPAIEAAGLVRKGRALVFRSTGDKVLSVELVEELRGERLRSLSGLATPKQR